MQGVPKSAVFAKENELLSDTVHTEGWRVVKAIAAAIEERLINDCLIPAENEWEAVKKDGNLTAVRNVRMLVEQVESRANQYRKGITPR